MIKTETFWIATSNGGRKNRLRDKNMTVAPSYVMYVCLSVAHILVTVMDLRC